MIHPAQLPGVLEQTELPFCFSLIERNPLHDVGCRCRLVRRQYVQEFKWHAELSRQGYGI